jgi:hypothetical protein
MMMLLQLTTSSMTFLQMTKEDIDKYEILSRLIRKEITGTEAANLLSLTIRHTKRLKAEVLKKGASGLIHKNRGQPSNRRMPKKERDKIVKLLRKYYPDFKPTLATEKLEENHNIHRDSKTIRQIMTKEGLWKPKLRKRKNQQHREWRERKHHYGEMQQFDGSYHDWFEGRVPESCLLASIDDATGKITHARFAQDEGVLPVFFFWQEYFITHGKPRTIYLDKFSTYKMNQQVAIENHETLTQFQRAMRELGVEPISAHSPQAKGRVERLFNTLQDRLVKDLRLAGISDTASANKFLLEVFLPMFNSKFSVPAKSETNLHCKLTPRERKELPSILSRHTGRTVQNDFTLSFQKQWYQLTKEQPATICKKDRVTVEEHTNGEIKIKLRGKYLNYMVLPKRPKRSTIQSWVLATAKKEKPKQTKSKWRPPQNHPWRTGQFIFNGSATSIKSFVKSKS